MADPFALLLLAWAGIAIATFVLLLRIRAPYGRHVRPGWGRTIPHRVGWVVMETVSPLTLVLAWASGGSGRDAWTLTFVALWLLHYANRAVVYPFASRWAGRRMPVVIMGSAVLFNAVNGALNGWWFGHVASPMPSGWILDPRFVLGAVLFVAGAAINLWADGVLRRLRRPGETGYAIPRGGLYRWISCPNYLGEILEWTGFAVMTWSPAAATFALWTAANLIPRAISHHRWYRERFEDYPADRRAIVPGVL